MRILRFFDWRFVLSVAFMMLVASVVFSSWSTAQQRDRLIEQNQHAQAVAASERHEAAQERRAILAGQRDLQRKYDGLLASQRGLVEWIQSLGYEVPHQFIVDENITHSRGGSEGHHHNNGHGTANSGPDNPSKAGGSGKASGGSTGGGGNSGGGKSHGKSGSKSHGKNKGGKSGSHAHKPHKAKKK